MDGQGKEGEDRCRHGDHDRPEADDPRIQEGLLEGLSLFMHFLDEIKEHDDVADDDADEAHDAEKGHEPEGGPHEGQGHHRPGHAVRDGGEDDEGLHGVFELDHQGDEDGEDGDGHDHGELPESLDLFLLLAADFQAVSRGQVLCQLLYGRLGFPDNFGGEDPPGGEAGNGKCPELVPPHDFSCLHGVIDGGNLT